MLSPEGSGAPQHDFATCTVAFLGSLEFGVLDSDMSQNPEIFNWLKDPV